MSIQFQKFNQIKIIRKERSTVSSIGLERTALRANEVGSIGADGDDDGVATTASSNGLNVISGAFDDADAADDAAVSVGGN